MIPLLGNVVENKKFAPTQQEPKIIHEDCIQGLGHGSPTDVEKVELVKTVGADPRS